MLIGTMAFDKVGLRKNMDRKIELSKISVKDEKLSPERLRQLSNRGVEGLL